MPLPEIPFDTSIDPTTQTVVTAVMGAFAAGAFLFSLYHWRRTGRPTFLLLFCAGGALMVFEPMVDTVGAVWFPEGNSWVAFTAYGRPIPVWLCLAYLFYFGIGIGVTWLVLKRGVSANKLWLLFGAGMLGDFILETILLAFDTYIYYGDQPLVVLKFPLWWAPVNSLIVMIAAAAILRLDDYLQGARQLVIIPIALTASAAGNAAAGWPSWFVINTELPWVLTQIGGLLTWALAFWLMSGIVRVLVAPAAKRSAPSAAREPAREPREPALTA